MKPYDGKFNPQPQAEASDKLPAGVYIGKIINAQEETSEGNGRTFRKLAIMLDVSEGEYEGFYTKQYNANKDSKFGAKYKGILRLNVPQTGDQYEENNRRKLEAAIWAIEESNPGYHWDWDEKKLKGKQVAFVVREFDWFFEGRTGTGTEIGKLAEIQDAREGKVKLMKKRPLKQADQDALNKRDADLQQMEEAMDEDIPF